MSCSRDRSVDTCPETTAADHCVNTTANAPLALTSTSAEETRYAKSKEVTAPGVKPRGKYSQPQQCELYGHCPTYNRHGEAGSG